MQNEKYKGKIYSFYELLESAKIEIPIIQRDYAQGRKDKKKIRHNFLYALYDSIKNEEKIMLDFIYGSNVEDSFQPLDGQQRLTTLFLLHWYAALKDSKLSSEESILIKFTYETRISSRDFCNSLIKNNINLQKDSLPSILIIDSPWFFLSWKNDPTIDAMLRTIDDIHRIFQETPNLWHKLTSQKHNLIRFYHVELENIGLTDDLYIKMNARGKLLSPFENFKAGFEKLLRDRKWEDYSDLRDSFAFKIDTKWTDLFWKHFRKNDSVDTSFVNFISTILMIRQSVERNKKTEERIRIISKLQEESNNIAPKLFELEDFNYLIECLNLISSKYEEISSINYSFPFFRHSPKENFLKDIILDADGASYTQKVLLFAQIEYFRKVKELDATKYLEWMRVVRNIISRGDVEKSGKRPDIVRSPQTFDGVIFLISELSMGCEDIYDYLSKIDSLKSTFAKEQIEEEKYKAKLIVNDPKLKNSIFVLEDTDLLRGRIDFVFYCLDIDKNTSIDSLEFGKVKDVFIEYLGSSLCLTNDLRRALLTISVDGKYEFYNYWWSFWTVVDSDKRRLIDKYREIEYLIYSDFKEYFKTIILKLKTQNLKDLADNFNPDENFPNWKLRLIKESNLLNENGSNYIAIPADNSFCYLLKSKRPRDKKGCMKIE